MMLRIGGDANPWAEAEPEQLGRCQRDLGSRQVADLAYAKDDPHLWPYQEES